MKKHNLLAIVRLFFGFLTVAAIVTQLQTSINNSWSIVNFFSFFTIESNILAAIIFIIVGIGTLMQQKSNPQFAFIRGAATLYMTMTGVIYVLLLSGNEVALQTTVPWVNIVLHYLFPAVVLLDWILFPPKFHLSFKKALWWLVFPGIYFIYSLIRGSFIGWYPYPFLNPSNGWGNLIITCVFIAIGVVGLTWLLTLRSARTHPK
jgi:hypothetical protein